MKKEEIKKWLKGILITVLVMIPVSFIAYRDIVFTLMYIPISLVQVLVVVILAIMIEELIKTIKARKGVKNHTIE